MKAGSTGERALVQKITRGLYAGKGVRVPSGSDDAAILKLGEQNIVLTTDILFSLSHFPSKLPFFQRGWRAAVASFSDIAAMGAFPTAFLASLGVPQDVQEHDLLQFVSGMNSACKKYGASFAGGDTKKSADFTAAGFAVGVLRGNVLLRSNARPGDIVAVTGEIGNAVCGLHAFMDYTQKISPKKLVDAFANPQARIKQGLVLSKLKRAAATDITDGLLFSASQIAAASGVSIRLERTKIPISKKAVEYASEKGWSFTKLVNSGEDFELVVSLPQKDFARARKKINLTQIGTVKKGSGLFLDGEKAEPGGFDAFLSSVH